MQKLDVEFEYYANRLNASIVCLFLVPVVAIGSIVLNSVWFTVTFIMSSPIIALAIMDLYAANILIKKIENAYGMEEMKIFATNKIRNSYAILVIYALASAAIFIFEKLM